MKVLNMQVSIFGSFENVGSEKDAKQIQDIFGDEFYPNLITAFKPGPTIITSQRVRVVSLELEKGLEFCFLPDRMDFNFNKDPYDENIINATNSSCIFETMDCLIEYAKKVVDIFDPKGWRLAVNGRIFSNKEFAMTPDQYLKLPDSIRNKNFVEWVNRINFQTEHSIHGSNEILNNIFSISMPDGSMAGKGVWVGFDINTSQFNKLFRFDKSWFDDFFNVVKENTKFLFESYGVEL